MFGAAAAYEVADVHKTYASPPVVANDGITLTVRAGEVFGLLGANGAGKSTLVRQMVGLLRPTSGRVSLFGEPVRPGSMRTPQLVSYMPQGSMSLGELRVREAVTWTGMLRGLDAPAARKQCAELLGELQLESLGERPTRKLSGGQRRLTQIAMTLIGRRPVLVLDEPTTDIDPALRLRIWDLLSERAGTGAAVVLVTHDVGEAEHALRRVAILRRGRVVVEGSPAQLKSGLSHRVRIDVVVREGNDAEAVCRDLGNEARVRGRRLSVWVPSEEAVARLDKIMTAAGDRTLEDVRLVTPTLEDVYLEVAGRSFAEDEGR